MVININSLTAGVVVTVKDGSTRIVTDNMEDGQWVETRPVEGSGDYELTHAEDILHAQH